MFLCRAGVETLFAWIIISQSRSAVGFLPQTGLMENGFLFERMLEIQSRHWSQIQADHFQDKYFFLLNCFRLPSEVTTLPPPEASHTGNITPSHKPWRSYLAALALVRNLRHGESKYGLLLISPAEMWILALWVTVLWFTDGEKYSWNWSSNRFSWGCCLNPKCWV